MNILPVPQELALKIINFQEQHGIFRCRKIRSFVAIFNIIKK